MIKDSRSKRADRNRSRWSTFTGHFSLSMLFAVGKIMENDLLRQWKSLFAIFLKILRAVLKGSHFVGGTIEKHKKIRQEVP